MATFEIPVEHGEAEVFLAAEVVEECAGGYTGGLQGLIQFGVVIPLGGEETGCLAQKVLAGFQGSRLLEG